MTFKAVIGAALVATLFALSATASNGVPGWLLTGSRPGDYEIGVEPTGGQQRNSAAFLRSVKPTVDGFGTLMQQFAADDYRGKRVRFSAAVRSQDVIGWSGLWMRVDDAARKTVAFDNMQKRPIKGSTGWQRHEVVLDVAPDAAVVSLGVLLNNSGQVWLDAPRVEVVPETVPTTSVAPATRAPQNLDFRR